MKFLVDNALSPILAEDIKGDRYIISWAEVRD